MSNSDHNWGRGERGEGLFALLNFLSVIGDH